MLIGKIIAIAQRRGINFHGTRGKEIKACFKVSCRVLPLPHHPLFPRLLKDNAHWKAGLFKGSWASVVHCCMSLVPSFPVPKASPPNCYKLHLEKGGFLQDAGSQPLPGLLDKAPRTGVHWDASSASGLVTGSKSRNQSNLGISLGSSG